MYGIVWSILTIYMCILQYFLGPVVPVNQAKKDKGKSALPKTKRTVASPFVMASRPRKKEKDRKKKKKKSKKKAHIYKILALLAIWQLVYFKLYIL